VSFRDPVSGDYKGVEKDRLTKEQEQWWLQQAEQENRRLLYVAITRSVYKCYIFRNESGKNKNSTLSVFLNALEQAGPSPGLICFEENDPTEKAGGYQKPVMKLKATSPAAVHFVLEEENWRKMSYTMLAAKPGQSPKMRSFRQEATYDNFIFHTLRRGAKTGNFLHFIFENLSFTDERRWDKRLEEGIRRFVPGQEEAYMPMLRQLLKEVLQADLRIGLHSFSLASVAWNRRIAEFEFDFPVPLFAPGSIASFSDEQASIYVSSPYDRKGQELEGIMNGKIDLFFEQDGRYYILDWKSNYLGASLHDYAPAALALAMNENNYHLQYLIYTLAAKKYLESRVEGFDYETQFGGVHYLFIRGMRAGSENGVYAIKPPLEKIQALEALVS
jgi:exodeoxyribonuclease V beta subunit